MSIDLKFGLGLIPGVEFGLNLGLILYFRLFLGLRLVLGLNLFVEEVVKRLFLSVRCKLKIFWGSFTHFFFRENSKKGKYATSRRQSLLLSQLLRNWERRRDCRVSSI